MGVASGIAVFITCSQNQTAISYPIEAPTDEPAGQGPCNYTGAKHADAAMRDFLPPSKVTV